MTVRLRELESKIAEHRKCIDALTKDLDSIKARTLVACTSSVYGKGCGMALEIGELTYIQTHWYERPHGCMGGDTWHESYGEFVCPHCGVRNRLYNRPEIQYLKRHFKSVENEYKD